MARKFAHNSRSDSRVPLLSLVILLFVARHTIRNKNTHKTSNATAAATAAEAAATAAEEMKNISGER